MSAVPSRPVEIRPTQADLDAFGYLGLRMNAEDFLGLGPTRERYQLIDGVVCMSPLPNTFHQRLLSLFIVQLDAFVRAHKGFKYLPEVDLVLADDKVYSPDLVCYRPGRVKGYPTRLTDPPDLVIEILSYGTKNFDLTTKRDDYRRFGVGEYWTYDPSDGRPPEPVGRLRCFRPPQAPVTAASGFLDVSPEASVIRFESVGISGFVLDLDPLRGGAED